MRLSELAAAVGAELKCGDDRDIVGVATLENAGPNQISFLANPKYVMQLATTRAGAVLVAPRHAARVPAGCVAVVCNDPYAAFATILNLMHPPPAATPGVHPRAIVAPDARVEGAEIGPGAVVGAGSVVGTGSIIGANVAIGANVTIGRDCRLAPGVVIYDGCVLGDRCILHANVVVGGDGFGFAPTAQGLLKIPQVGRVVLGNDVELGAGTTVDRGALGDTVLEDGVKLDNLVQVGHNVRIGAHTVIAAQTGISGSVTIGRGCMIGGQVGIAGHLSIGDGVRIAARAGVMRDVAAGAKVGGSPAVAHGRWLRTLAAIDRLPELVRRSAPPPEEEAS